MIQFKQVQIVLIFISLLLVGCGSSASREVTAGNEAFEEGDYVEAMDAYQNAQELAPLKAEPIYNLANTRYRQGVYTDTIFLLPEAVAIGSDETEEDGYFNLGNANFQLQQWETAAEAYKDVLRRDPSDLDAKYNLELAMRNLQEAEQQQEEEEQQDEEQQDEEQQEEEQQEEQENQQEQNQEQQNQEQQNQEQQNQEQQNEEQSEEQQQEESAGDGSEEDTEEEPESDDDGGEETPPPAQAEQPQNVQPQQGLSLEQARQLLSAVGKNTETLQERMQQVYVSPDSAPDKDW